MCLGPYLHLVVPEGTVYNPEMHIPATLMAVSMEIMRTWFNVCKPMIITASWQVSEKEVKCQCFSNRLMSILQFPVNLSNSDDKCDIFNSIWFSHTVHTCMSVNWDTVGLDNVLLCFHCQCCYIINDRSLCSIYNHSCWLKSFEWHKGYRYHIIISALLVM